MPETMNTVYQTADGFHLFKGPRFRAFLRGVLIGLLPGVALIGMIAITPVMYDPVGSDLTNVYWLLTGFAVICLFVSTFMIFRFYRFLAYVIGTLLLFVNIGVAFFSAFAAMLSP